MSFPKPALLKHETKLQLQELCGFRIVLMLRSLPQGFQNPTFIFFASSPGQILNQEKTWLRCLTPPLTAGTSPVLVYSGGIPSNRDVTYVFRDSDDAMDIVKHEVEIAEGDEMFGEEGIPLFNPETFDWEYPMFVETMLQDFCSPEAANQTSFGATALHIVLTFDDLPPILFFRLPVLEKSVFLNITWMTDQTLTWLIQKAVLLFIMPPQGTDMTKILSS